MNVYKESNVFQTFSAEHCLEQGYYSKYVEEIQVLTGLTEPIFSDVYQPLLKKFIDKVQYCPDPHMNNQPWVHVSLERAKMALNRACALDTQDERMVYAAFSAALCLMMGRLATEVKVSFTNAKGLHWRNWNPLSESIGSCCEYYRVRPMIGMPGHLAEHLTPLMAREVMPELGITWIADEPWLMLQWLATLMQSSSDAGELGAICTRAEQYLKSNFNSIKDDLADVLIPDSLQEAESFWHWLKSGLLKDQFKLNSQDALVHKLHNGSIFLREEIFKAYLESIGERSSNWVVLMQQFNHLGLTRLSGSDAKFDQYFGSVRRVPSQFSSNLFSSGKVKQEGAHQLQNFWTQSQGSSCAFSTVAQAQAAAAGSQHSMTGVTITPGNLLLPSSMGVSSIIQPASVTGAIESLVQHQDILQRSAQMDPVAKG
ncbi:MAG: hypothetical protein CMF51_01570 [Legionellales bacterium]|nr:hypothetical protein [Legionellales bacterium]